MADRRIFWATAPGTDARRHEEKILRDMGLLGEVRELKNQAEALGLAFLTTTDTKKPEGSEHG